MTRSLSLSLSVCLFSGRRVGGQTALEMGLVNRAVEQNQTGDAAYREALTLAREILPQVRMQTHTIPLCHSSDTDASPPTPSPAGQGPGLPPHFSSAFLSASLHSAFLPSWCFLPPPHLSPSSLPSLQASVAPYFFHSSSDGRSWQGQSGSQVEKWTTNSSTHIQTPHASDVVDSCLTGVCIEGKWRRMEEIIGSTSPRVFMSCYV